MNMDFGLYQEQTQKLVLTTQMKQAIAVLQCSTLELNQFLSTELEQNPFVDFEPVVHPDEELWWMKAAVGGGYSSRSQQSEQRQSLEQIIHSETSLEELLESQLRLAQSTPQVYRIARYLIGSLDENGYLQDSVDAIAQTLGVAQKEVDAAVELLQTCDPPGIGARNLKECLLLQLSFVPEAWRDIVQVLIESHLEDIGAGRIANISRALKLPKQRIQGAVDEIRRLNPRPALAYRGESPHYIIPDVVVQRVEDHFVVMTNESAQPLLRISPLYRRMLESHSTGETRAYLQRKFQSAQWLVRCLEQRRMTLYRVAEAITEQQQGFFRMGLSAMKPLTLKQIAEMVGLHESTISRATRGKYMQTPRGVFEMKFFFSAEIQTQSGTVSAQAAKYEIKCAIEKEDSAQPLSDDALAKQLAVIGLKVSRRTVAKYREEMQIPPSWRRRRFD